MAGTMVACSPDEFPGMDEAGIPAVSQYSSLVNVAVDQETNEVVFTLDAPGVYPVWVIKEGDKEIRSSVNGYARKFLVSGTYSYQCFIANRDGVSKDCVSGTFTLNTSRIDISKEVGFLTAAPWHVASSKPGHLGCGPDMGNPAGWWSAGANEKADWGVYDSVLDFSADNTYTMDPGESGVIYVNKGVTVNGWSSYLTEDADYNVPVTEVQKSDWTIEIDGTDLWLNLGKNPYFPYVAHDQQWTTPRLKIVSISAKTMTLVTANYPNGDGTISWQYILTTEAEGAKDPKDILVGTWRIDNEAAGHLGCGESMENSGGWWSAGPNEKADWGVYDCTVTFEADGKYTLNSGSTDMIYVNKGVKVNGWDKYYKGDDNDFNVPGVGTQTSTWTVKDDVINLGSNPYFPYIANDEVWNTPEYHIVDITDDHMKLVIWNGGIAWQYILVKAKPESLDYDDPNNMWKAVDEGEKFLSVTPWFSPADWSGGLTPEWSHEGNVWNVTLPEGMGGGQWQGQFPINTTLTAAADATYDFSCTIEADTDCEGITIKLVETDVDSTDEGKRDSNMFFDARHNVKEGEPYVYTVKGAKIAKADAHALSLFFDFGGSPVGANVKISNIVLIKN